MTVEDATAPRRPCDCSYHHFGYHVKGCASNFPVLPSAAPAPVEVADPGFDPGSPAESAINLLIDALRICEDRCAKLAAEKAEAERKYAALVASDNARTENAEARAEAAEALLRDCWPIIDTAGAGWLRARWPANCRAPKDA